MAGAAAYASEIRTLETSLVGRLYHLAYFVTMLVLFERARWRHHVWV